MYTRGVWLDLACAMSADMSSESRSGAERSALRVRTSALFCMVGLECVDGLSWKSTSTAMTLTSLRQESERDDFEQAMYSPHAQLNKTNASAGA